MPITLLPGGLSFCLHYCVLPCFRAWCIVPLDHVPANGHHSFFKIYFRKDDLGSLDGNANYHGGNRALRFQADGPCSFIYFALASAVSILLNPPMHWNFKTGGGFVYYPSGNVAVCVSVVNSYQKNFFFYADDHSGWAYSFAFFCFLFCRIMSWQIARERENLSVTYFRRCISWKIDRQGQMHMRTLAETHKHAYT